MSVVTGWLARLPCVQCLSQCMRSLSFFTFSSLFAKDFHDFDVEVECGVGRDEAVSDVLIAISHIRRASKSALCSDFKTLEALVPRFDHLSGADLEFNGLVSVMAAVKFRAVRCK